MDEVPSLMENKNVEKVQDSNEGKNRVAIATIERRRFAATEWRFDFQLCKTFQQNGA